MSEFVSASVVTSSEPETEADLVVESLHPPALREAAGALEIVQEDEELDEIDDAGSER